MTYVTLRILGVPNRLFLVFAFSCLSVAVEVLLHEAGVFHWEYWWWNVPFVPLIVIFGYGTFFAMAAYVHDLPDNRRRLTSASRGAFKQTVGASPTRHRDTH